MRYDRPQPRQRRQQARQRRQAHDAADPEATIFRTRNAVGHGRDLIDEDLGGALGQRVAEHPIQVRLHHEDGLGVGGQRDSVRVP